MGGRHPSESMVGMARIMQDGLLHWLAAIVVVDG
jgi:hypothetical protein